MKARMIIHCLTQITRVMFISAIFIFGGISSVYAQGSFEFVSKWGSPGTGDGEFNSPRGIAVDSYGNIYVADSTNERIQKFDSSGAFLDKWGSYGSGDGQFDHVKGVAVDSSGNVYGPDTHNHRIQKFDQNGNFLG